MAEVKSEAIDAVKLETVQSAINSEIKTGSDTKVESDDGGKGVDNANSVVADDDSKTVQEDLKSTSKPGSIKSHHSSKGSKSSKKSRKAELQKRLAMKKNELDVLRAVNTLEEELIQLEESEASEDEFESKSLFASTVKTNVQLIKSKDVKIDSGVEKEGAVEVLPKVKVPTQKLQTSAEPSALPPDSRLDPLVGPYFPTTMPSSYPMYNYLNQRSNERTSKLMYLNTISPIKFAGQSKDYPSFKERVRMNLDDGILSEAEMVELLPKFLEGEPLEVVGYMQGSSFQIIMSKLEEMFGHPQKVANSFINELTTGPMILASDRKALERYAALLKGAEAVLKGSYFEAASCLPNLKRMADRLPSFARNEWEKRVVLVTETKDAPDLHDLAVFVDRISRQKNNPYYQNTLDTRTKKLDSFTTETATEPDLSIPRPLNKGTTACAICNHQHDIGECSEFKGMTLPQRMSTILSMRRCFICLKASCKPYGECTKRSSLPTTCKRCNRPHHTLLRCYGRKRESDVSATNVTEAGSGGDREERAPNLTSPDLVDVSIKSGSDETIDSAHANVSKCSRFMMMVIPILLHGPDGRALSTYGFLDTGSGASFIDKSLARELGITGPVEYRTIRTVVSEHREELEKVQFEISSITMAGKPRVNVNIETYVMLDVNLKDHVQGKILPCEVDVSKFRHLRQLPFPTVDRPQIGVLLGLPIREAHEVIRYHRGRPEEPFAIETGLGFALAGQIDMTTTTALQCSTTSIAPAPTLEEMVERMWALDEFGNYRPEDSLSSDDQKAIERFNETVSQRPDSHYQSGLLWKDPNMNMSFPNNRSAALRRLRSLEKKFKREGPEYERMYRTAMNEYIEMGWASLIPEEELRTNNLRIYYLSHFGVEHPNKPGKIRPVYDAAEMCHGVSLNSTLLSGPDSTNSLIGVLTRARYGKYCVSGDVKSMFNQCFVNEEDRDSLRFLWFDADGEVRDYRMNVHVFGAADSPFCANRILKQVAMDHGHKYDENVVEAVNISFYVDDVMWTAGTREEIVALVKGTTSLLAEGGFKLTKFVGNDKRVMSELDDKSEAFPTGMSLFVEPLPVRRALGLLWNTDDDCFGYRIQNVNQNLTLRGLTSTVARIFDPLGMIAPAVLRGRRIIQECWARKLSWNDDLPEDLAASWAAWLQELPILETLKIPRQLFSNVQDCRIGVTDMQLHLFADSSQYATGAASYLRAVDTSGDIHVSNLIIGKAKLLPLKPKLTIPRAEMKAAVDVARLAEKLKAELRLKLDSVCYWSDSKIVLSYIRNETRSFRPFIANRQSEIRRFSTPTQWRFAPGILNVGDDPSRGLKASEFHADHRYLVGPSFLRLEEEKWPIEPTPVDLKADDPELRKEVASFPTQVISEDTGILNIIERNSSYTRILRIVSWAFRLVRAKRNDPTIRHPLTSEDLTVATRIVVRAVQAQHYAKEMSDIAQSGQVNRGSSLASLAPFVDQYGILRVTGRVQRAEQLDYAAKHPMILPNPKVCQLSSTILYHLHQTLAHGGLELILSAAREEYWIMGDRVFTKSLIRNCVPCRRRNERPLTQLMGDLPASRLRTYESAFTYTGTDCFGPLKCKRWRREVKCYGVIFLCMTTKNVHIELVPSLSTDDFICALMRMVSLRGPVRKLYSDNGSNYLGAERELRQLVEAWNKEKIAVEMLAKGTDWKFQPPYASSQSGIWERRVKETKRHLYAILQSHTPHPETLRTALYEVAAILNQVPLCPVSNDPGSFEALTPAHFLFQRPAELVVPVGNDDAHSYRREKWRTVCHLSTLYWRRWLKEYVPTLSKRIKWTNRRRNLSVGDLVMIVDADLPRSRWLLGRVSRVNYGSTDGLVRSAVVSTTSGEFLRPIQKLAVIQETNNDE